MRPADCWPTPAQERTLRAALLSGPEARPAFEEWERGFRPDLSDSGTRRLLPLVHENVQRHGIETPLRMFLQRRRTAARRGTLRLFEETVPLLAALEQVGIPTLVLKGAALAALEYGDPGLRPMADLDVLVPTERAFDAFRLLQDHGCQPGRPLPSRPADLAASHSVSLRLASGRQIDLHWHVFDGCCGSADDGDLWQAAKPFTLYKVATRTLGRADLLLHVCVHGHRWLHVPGCRWVADAAVIVRSGAPLDWDRLVEQAQKRRFVAGLLEALRYVRERFGVHVPGSALERLARTRVAWSERAAHRARTTAPELRGPLLTLGLHRDSYRRLRRSGALAAGPAGLQAFARHTWGATSLWAVPAMAVAKGLRRVVQIARGPRP